MSFIEPILPDLEGGLAGLLNILGFAKGESVDDALTRLYGDTNRLAILTVKFIVAVVWWGSHIGSAASDAYGYSAQIRAALAKADDNLLTVWREWLDNRYPTDLQALYDDLYGQIVATQKSIPKQHKVNLKPIEKRLAALETWKQKTASPELRRWTRFYATWKHTYLPPLRTLIRWLHSPRTFANWALPPLLAQAPSTMRKPSMRKRTAAIETALLASWVNDPQVVYDSVLKWLVST